MFKYLIAWFPMLILAILNGIFREGVIKNYVDDFAAHQLSTFTLLILFSIYIWLVISRFPPASSQQALLTGLLWLVLTLGFEFGFGRYRGNSWDMLLGEYNLLEGKLWVLIPLWVAIAPYLFYRMQKS